MASKLSVGYTSGDVEPEDREYHICPENDLCGSFGSVYRVPIYDIFTVTVYIFYPF